MMLTKNSTHRVDIVPIKNLRKHPNADLLSLIDVWNYTCIVASEDFEGVQFGAFIPPDSVCSDRPEFFRLKGNLRIKARRFRGLWSQGFLVPAPSGFSEGDDVAEYLGVTHYEPPVVSVGGGGVSARGPELTSPHYDLENWYRYSDRLVDGEEVIITEKLDGSNARFVYFDDQMYVGSRSRWVQKNDRVLWWRALLQNSWVYDFCIQNHGIILYGEVFGNIQRLKYNFKKGDYGIRIFDAFYKDSFIDNQDLYKLEGLNFVPHIYRGPYSKEIVEHNLSGMSKIEGAPNIREGIVIKPIKERFDRKIGRVALKAVSPEFLEKY